MGALRDSREDDFIDAVCTHLALHMPQMCERQSASDLRCFVQQAIIRGKAFGITGERDMATWVSVLGALGEGPEQRRHVEAYLSDARVPRIGDRVSRLASATLRHLDLAAQNAKIRACAGSPA